jgi:hypothetical protein
MQRHVTENSISLTFNPKQASSPRLQRLTLPEDNYTHQVPRAMNNSRFTINIFTLSPEGYRTFIGYVGDQYSIEQKPYQAVNFFEREVAIICAKYFESRNQDVVTEITEFTPQPASDFTPESAKSSNADEIPVVNSSAKLALTKPKRVTFEAR